MMKFKTGYGKPVVALDIDGTLGDYHKHFLWFAEQWLGRKMPSATEINPGMSLSTFMDIPHYIYRECKLAYRQGGLKRFMPAYPYSSHLTHTLSEAGAEVWLCTTRPYLRLDNIDPDTREWLDRNNIHYDAVIFDDIAGGMFSEDSFSSSKYRELVRQVGAENVVAAVDDLPEQLTAAATSGILKLYLRTQPYNRGEFAKFTRVDSVVGLAAPLLADIAQWKAKNG